MKRPSGRRLLSARDGAGPGVAAQKVRVSLFPVPDRVLRYVDAAGELVLGEAQALADAPDELSHVPHRFGLVSALPCGSVSFGSAGPDSVRALCLVKGRGIIMTEVNPLDIPAATAGTIRAAPVYRYLMQQPDHWLRQAFFVGRPKLPVSRVIESMRANSQSLENAAQDWSLPVEALKEALDYYGRFHDVIEADEADELALSDELARSHPPKP